MKGIFISILMIASFGASAHPGRTAGDGCHYCRTNCDSWGVPWNARHCHGGFTDEKKPEMTISKLSSLAEQHTSWSQHAPNGNVIEHGHSHEGEEQHMH